MKRVAEYSLALLIDVILLVCVVSNLDIRVKDCLEDTTSSLKILVDYILITRKITNDSNSFNLIEFHGIYSDLIVLYLGGEL